jgi:hypothetical protein
MVLFILFAGVFGISFAAISFFATIAHMSWPTSKTLGWLTPWVSLLVFGLVIVCLLLVWGTLFALVAGEVVLFLRACT